MFENGIKTGKPSTLHFSTRKTCPCLVPSLPGSSGGHSVHHVSSAPFSSLGKKKWNSLTECSCISSSSLSVALILSLIWLETIGTTLWKNENGGGKHGWKGRLRIRRKRKHGQQSDCDGRKQKKEWCTRNSEWNSQKIQNEEAWGKESFTSISTNVLSSEWALWCCWEAWNWARETLVLAQGGSLYISELFFALFFATVFSILTQ